MQLLFMPVLFFAPVILYLFFLKGHHPPEGKDWSTLQLIGIMLGFVGSLALGTFLAFYAYGFLFFA